MVHRLFCVRRLANQVLDSRESNYLMICAVDSPIKPVYQKIISTNHWEISLCRGGF
jgi:hypothetical protein